MRFERVLHFILIISLVTSSGGSIALAATGYGITSSDDIDTPDQTVTIDGTEYDVSSIGRVYKNDALTIDTNAPAGTSYDIYIYNDDRNIVDTAAAEGDDSASFDTSYFGSPGSYVAAIYIDGSIERIHPVVVSGYRVSVDAPKSAPKGEDITVDLSLSKVTDIQDPYSVEVVVAQGNSVVKRIDASQTGSLSYQATLSNDLNKGDYNLYAVARSETTVDGKHELVGISDTQQLTVKSRTTTTANSGDGSSEATETTTATPTATTTTASTPTPTTTESPTTTTEHTSTESPTTTSESVTTTVTSQTTDSSVLTPNNDNTDSSSKTTTESSLPAPWLSALGILFTGLILVIRRRRKK
ncbi:MULTISPECIES: cell surface glycoprotein [Haloferax]|uniref:Cell surface glycoprotein n=1 Tax=Haloferax marinum TaxID=2666143 RepID=A0A6A8G9B8_9EURY|nr:MULTISPECIES: cell surface glycoprotein [Haloferax]KAB1198234.1 cell surface glycoprotein [Haloferax sp. CBA1150]MRW97325.1 cell surface glycoprotein [Haloferax marinum]